MGGINFITSPLYTCRLHFAGMTLNTVLITGCSAGGIEPALVQFFQNKTFKSSPQPLTDPGCHIYQLSLTSHP